MTKLEQAILSMHAAGQPFVLASVSEGSGSMPRHRGACMLVRMDGSTVGSVGGGALEAEAIQQFQSHGESYAAMRQRRILLAQNAIVSRKILDEGWKVGYMERTETDRDGDSGWFFASGTEEPGYLDDYHHLALVPVGIVWQQFDPDIFRYLDSPAGTRLMRVSEDRFEPDQPDREIYAVRR